MFWTVIFEDNSAVSVKAKNSEEAAHEAESLTGKTTKEAYSTPYPQQSIQNNDFPPFCWGGKSCAGKTSCPKSRACND